MLVHVMVASGRMMRIDLFGTSVMIVDTIGMTSEVPMLRLDAHGGKAERAVIAESLEPCAIEELRFELGRFCNPLELQTPQRRYSGWWDGLKDQPIRILDVKTTEQSIRLRQFRGANARAVHPTTTPIDRL